MVATHSQWLYSLNATDRLGPCSAIGVDLLREGTNVFAVTAGHPPTRRGGWCRPVRALLALQLPTLDGMGGVSCLRSHTVLWPERLSCFSVSCVRVKLNLVVPRHRGIPWNVGFLGLSLKLDHSNS